jgi:ERCC4-type nuclease
MITLDDRIGSAELARPLKKLGCKVQVKRMEFADIAWQGHTAHGLCPIGVERKKVAELVNAMTDTRFTGHQIPGLLKHYADRYLLIEGRYWADPRTGLLIVNGREAGYGLKRFMYRDFEHFVMSIRRKARLEIVQCSCEKDTAWWLHTAYTWYTDKTWEQHKSVYAIDEVRPDTAILDERTLLRRVAAQLPSVGWVRSKVVEERFGSIHEMCNARVADWCEIKGIGKGIARNVVRAIRATR